MTDGQNNSTAQEHALPSYWFENIPLQRNWNNKIAEADKAAELFLERLGLSISASQLSTESRRLLTRYCSIHQVTIHWYMKKILKKKASQAVYFFVSAGLVILIPTGVWFLPGILDPGGEVELLPAQITGAVTGLLALHRVIQTWFEKRNMIAAWWEASADLKGDLFGLEDRWRGRDGVIIENEGAHVLGAAFRAELEAGIASARKIIRKEKDAFYKKLSEHPSLDVASVLSASRQDAAKITADWINPAVKKEIESAVAADVKAEKARGLQDELRGYEAVLEDLKAEIEAARAGGDSAADKINYYAVVREKRDDTELALIKARAAGA